MDLHVTCCQSALGSSWVWLEKHTQTKTNGKRNQKETKTDWTQTENEPKTNQNFNAPQTRWKRNVIMNVKTNGERNESEHQTKTKRTENEKMNRKQHRNEAFYFDSNCQASSGSSNRSKMLGNSMASKQSIWIRFELRGTLGPRSLNRIQMLKPTWVLGLL